MVALGGLALIAGVGLIFMPELIAIGGFEIATGGLIAGGGTLAGGAIAVPVITGTQLAATIATAVSSPP